MSKMAELDMYAYDIEQLYIEGLTEKNISKTWTFQSSTFMLGWRLTVWQKRHRKSLALIKQ